MVPKVAETTPAVALTTVLLLQGGGEWRKDNDFKHSSYGLHPASALLKYRHQIALHPGPEKKT